jgi:hypothetical protein
MKQTREPTGVREPRKQASQKDPRDRDAMSSSMRQLILSFGEADSERTWDPTVYSRRVEPAR